MLSRNLNELKKRQTNTKKSELAQKHRKNTVTKMVVVYLVDDDCGNCKMFLFKFNHALFLVCRQFFFQYRFPLLYLPEQVMTQSVL